MMNSKDPEPPLATRSMRIDVGLALFQLDQGEHEVWQDNGDIFAFDELLALCVCVTGLCIRFDDWKLSQ